MLNTFCLFVLHSVHFCFSESVPVNSKVCFIKFEEASNVGVALHLTNTVFIDRALIVVPASFSRFTVLGICHCGICSRKSTY